MDLPPGEAMALSASTVNLYMALRYPGRFRLQERPFVVQYACQDPSGHSRRIMLQIEGRGRHDLLFRILCPILCIQDDLVRVVDLVREWNEAHPLMEVRLMNGQAISHRWGDQVSRTVVIALESRTKLEPHVTGLSLERFSELLESMMIWLRDFSREAAGRYGF